MIAAINCEPKLARSPYRQVGTQELRNGIDRYRGLQWVSVAMFRTASLVKSMLRFMNDFLASQKSIARKSLCTHPLRLPTSYFRKAGQSCGTLHPLSRCRQPELDSPTFGTGGKTGGIWGGRLRCSQLGENLATLIALGNGSAKQRRCQDFSVRAAIGAIE